MKKKIVLQFFFLYLSLKTWKKKIGLWTFVIPFFFFSELRAFPFLFSNFFAAFSVSLCFFHMCRFFLLLLFNFLFMWVRFFSTFLSFACIYYYFQSSIHVSRVCSAPGKLRREWKKSIRTFMKRKYYFSRVRSFSTTSFFISRSALLPAHSPSDGSRNRNIHWEMVFTVRVYVLHGVWCVCALIYFHCAYFSFSLPLPSTIYLLLSVASVGRRLAAKKERKNLHCCLILSVLFVRISFFLFLCVLYSAQKCTYTYKKHTTNAF